MRSPWVAVDACAVWLACGAEQQREPEVAPRTAESYLRAARPVKNQYIVVLKEQTRTKGHPKKDVAQQARELVRARPDHHDLLQPGTDQRRNAILEDEESGLHRERARRVVREQAPHLGLRHDRLHGAREREAEDQRPEDLPEHPERERERLPELVPHHRRSTLLRIKESPPGNRAPDGRPHHPRRRWW